MKVHGFEVPDEALKACEARMKDGRPFRAAHIAVVAELHGVPEFVQRGIHKEACSDRVADRLIQWHRKRLHIRFEGHNTWKWIQD
jgi:hypothetical protein